MNAEWASLSKGHTGPPSQSSYLHRDVNLYEPPSAEQVAKADRKAHEFLNMTPEEAAAFQFCDMVQMHRVLDQLQVEIVNTDDSEKKKALLRKLHMMDGLITQHEVDDAQRSMLRKKLKAMRKGSENSGVTIGQLQEYRLPVEACIEDAISSVKYCQTKFAARGSSGKNQWVASALEEVQTTLQSVLRRKSPCGALVFVDHVLVVICQIFVATGKSAGGWEVWFSQAFGWKTLAHWKEVNSALRCAHDLAAKGLKGDASQPASTEARRADRDFLVQDAEEKDAQAKIEKQLVSPQSSKARELLDTDTENLHSLFSPQTQGGVCGAILSAGPSREFAAYVEEVKRLTTDSLNDFMVRARTSSLQ